MSWTLWLNVCIKSSNESTPVKSVWGLFSFNHVLTHSQNAYHIETNTFLLKKRLLFHDMLNTLRGRFFIIIFIFLSFWCVCVCLWRSVENIDGIQCSSHGCFCFHYISAVRDTQCSLSIFRNSFLLQFIIVFMLRALYQFTLKLRFYSIQSRRYT